MDFNPPLLETVPGIPCLFYLHKAQKVRAWSLASTVFVAAGLDQDLAGMMHGTHEPVENHRIDQ